MKTLLAALTTSLVLALAACGGDDEESAPENGQPAPVETAPEQEDPNRADQRGEGFEIEVVDIDYNPNEATVPAGTTVTFTNTGDLPHTVTKDSGPGEDFDSGTMSPGDTFEQTFEEPGRVDYLCTIHPGQEGTLTVE